MSGTQGHAGSGADAICAKNTDWGLRGRILFDYAKSLESEVSRLRAELGEVWGELSMYQSCVRQAAIKLQKIQRTPWVGEQVTHYLAERAAAKLNDSELIVCEAIVELYNAMRAGSVKVGVATRPASPAEREKGEGA